MRKKTTRIEQLQIIFSIRWDLSWQLTSRRWKPSLNLRRTLRAQRGVSANALGRILWGTGRRPVCCSGQQMRPEKWAGSFHMRLVGKSGIWFLTVISMETYWRGFSSGIGRIWFPYLNITLVDKELWRGRNEAGKPFEKFLQSSRQRQE